MYKKKHYMKQRESVYSWTSLQRPPWGQKNVAIVKKWPAL